MTAITKNMRLQKFTKNFLNEICLALDCAGGNQILNHSTNEL